MFQLILLAVLVSIIFILYLKYHYSYWSRRGITQLEPGFFFGNVKPVIQSKQSEAEVYRDMYWRLKKLKMSAGGFYFLLKPNLLVLDPEIIKHVMVKDFQYFSSRGRYYDEESDPLSIHLFNLDGAQWRKMRTKLTPTFTSGKMKMMFHTILKCSNELVDVTKEYVQKSQTVDMKEIMVLFTLDVIGTCAFGIDCNCLRNSDSEFRKHGVCIFVPQGMDKIKRIVANVNADILRLLKIHLLNKDATEFFMGVVKETIQYREENNIQRPDFLQLLIQLKNQGKLEEDGSIQETASREKTNELFEEDSLSMNELVAQCFVFFLAGFETSSSTMTFCLFELCKNPDIQEKIRIEINEVLEKHNGEVTYSAINEMKYLEQVIDETLRKYPVIGFLTRKCIQDYKLPDRNFVIKKNEVVYLSPLAMQNDPEYFPNPEKFDPDRFSEENKKFIPPYTYMPFGHGPRVCIGLRFGMMQAKLGLLQILRRYKVSPSEKMKETIEFESNSFTLAPKGGMWLNLSPVLD